MIATNKDDGIDSKWSKRLKCCSLLVKKLIHKKIVIFNNKKADSRLKRKVFILDIRKEKTIPLVKVGWYLLLKFGAV